MKTICAMRDVFKSVCGTERRFEKVFNLGQVVEIEEHPSDNYNNQRINMPDCSRQFLENLSDIHFFKHQEHKII